MATLSIAALQSLNASQTGETWLAFVDLAHASFPATQRFVLNTVDVASGPNSNAYIALPMDIEIGSEGADAFRELRLVLGVVDQTLINHLENALRDNPVIVDIYYALGSDPTTIMAQNTGLELRSYTTNGITIEAVLAIPSWALELFPGIHMNKERIPGIFP